MAIIGQDVDAFEGASIDEAYVDLSSLGDLERAQDHARMLKRTVLEREGLTCSVGIGPNKLVAKIASDFRKPDGLTVVRPDDVQGFLDGLPIRVIPGVGPKTEGFLHERGIKVVADLRGPRAARLREWLGKGGEDLHRKAHGLSDDPVSNEWERKSVESRRRSRRTPSISSSSSSARGSWPTRCSVASSPTASRAFAP